MGRKPDRPSYGELPAKSKCTRCRERAVIHLPAHHANFCEDCFLHFFRTAVKRAMRLFPFRRGERIMVAVSGGKDSLATWLVLSELGYETKGVHLDLGIPEFSEASRRAVENFSGRFGLPLSIFSLKDEFGMSLPEIERRSRRVICAVCGTIKRHLLGRIAAREGFRHVATGHNLDDEAARLLGNIVRHRDQYIEKAYPYLPPIGDMIPGKIKPLFRVEAAEIRIYCRVRGIDFFGGSCPFSRGATSHVFQEALEFLEEKMPGTKRDFLLNYLKKRTFPPPENPQARCEGCGYPSYRSLCSLCSLRQQMGLADRR
ncbi:ATP-binding protein [Thermodesulforhabdus norvegica]|uniref:TIGR00269 family protein n=1 Tax=Thermodesulforhabdus norvegica TaxID=39841 RepID=A0A1I4W600_9BACT|nr:ATP-binding protein [Thermodesulforhabdus norvegica]SFN08872.1 TIGR00269 family protein [Thermodesulforhabdus norvegica]